MTPESAKVVNMLEKAAVGEMSPTPRSAAAP